MGEIVLNMMISIDGYVAGLDNDLDWIVSPDQDREADDLALLNEAECIVIGRGVYYDMVDYWPTATGDYADRVNSLPKHVVSTIHADLEWSNATSLVIGDQGDISAELHTLKATTNGSVMVFGGARLARNVVSHNLVDIYQLVVTPVALGSGTPLFGGLPKRLELSVENVRPYPSGTCRVHYRPTRAGRQALVSESGREPSSTSPHQQAPALDHGL